MVKDIPIEELYSQPIVKNLLQKLSDNTANIDLNNIKLPYIIKDKVLMSPGVWNDFFYSSDSIKDAFLKSEWDNKEIRSLFLDHVDNSSREWIGEVQNQRMAGDSVIGDLVIVDMATAQKLAYGAKMGISPKVYGMEEENEMLDFSFSNFSVVINPAVKTAYINNRQKETEIENAVKEPYGKVKYADPGYKGDKKRYPIDSEAHVRAAWSYINMPKNQEGYTAEQIKNIKGRITSAAKKYGISIKNNEEVNKMTEEETPKIEPAPVAEVKEDVAAAPAEPIAEAPKEEVKEPAPAEAVEAPVAPAAETENSEIKEEFKAMSELDIVVKAKELQKKNESLKDALIRAAKEMEVKDEKENEMAETDVINQILKLAEILKNKVAPVQMAEAPKVDDNKESEKKMTEMKKTINELSEKLVSVETKLNEPAPKTAMKTEELSAVDSEKLVSADPDTAFMHVLKGMGGM